ncbi:unnamed protein product [Prunus armeniaca]|uniref:Cullin N-terminal domain-containing protein n=1 Tax=Prunus armeniaca TaxID=36596 RepID=A0A6J5W400_PRUAR|nr:unnamed protein product [Prunus armeniaca]
MSIYAFCLYTAFPTIPENFEEETWTEVKSAISKIFLKKEAALHSLDCLNLIECERHIAAELESLVQYQTPDSVALLSCIDTCWQDHSERMSLINRIMGSALSPFRFEGKPTPKLPKLWDMGFQLFRKHLFRSPTVESDIVTCLLGMVDKERSGEDVVKTLLSRLLKMFKALGIYSESLETLYLEWTSEFYAAEGVKYMQHSDVPDYLKHVETRLREEHERCLHYMDASTEKSLVGIAEKQLLDCHISAILDKVFSWL